MKADEITTKKIGNCKHQLPWINGKKNNEHIIIVNHLAIKTCLKSNKAQTCLIINGLKRLTERIRS